MAVDRTEAMRHDSPGYPGYTEDHCPRSISAVIFDAS